MRLSLSLIALFLVFGLGIGYGILIAPKHQQTSLLTKPAAATAPGPSTLPPNQIDSRLAQDFARWWLSIALDFSGASIAHNQFDAPRWMNRDAYVAYRNTFGHAMSSKSLRDRVVFLPTCVSYFPPKNGAMYIGVCGVFVCRTSPPTHHVGRIDLSITRDSVGYRINQFSMSEAGVEEVLKQAERLPTCSEQAFAINRQASYNLGRGAVALVNKNFKEAIGWYTAAIAHDSKMGEAYVCRALARSEVGDRNGAFQDARNAATLDPQYTHGHVCFGEELLKRGDKKAALKEFDSAIRLNPELSEAFAMRGETRGQLKDYSGGISDLSKAIELAPNCYMAYYRRGCLKVAAGDKSGAKSDFEQTLRLEPNDVSARKALKSL
ncbi:MAG TPA: tetratricopeptide repeat protein [Planktothrix sp.]|jgi:Tfp pilus assembly protein PilF